MGTSSRRLGGEFLPPRGCARTSWGPFSSGRVGSGRVVPLMQVRPVEPRACPTAEVEAGALGPQPQGLGSLEVGVLSLRLLMCSCFRALSC